MTAATCLGRFRRRVAVIDKGWSRGEWIARSRNLPGFPAGVGGRVLLDLMRCQACCRELMEQVDARPGVGA